MTFNLVKVSKAQLLMCLKCPLCSNLVHEATTISECLHTFCRDCIHQELDEEESDCCPICNVNLGCSPLEKLRADRQLDDVCAKIFPPNPKKRKVIDEDVDNDLPARAKRKERSLSSLGIGIPPSANPGFVKRKTKSVTRKSSTASTSKETSTDADSDGKQSDVVKSEVDEESEATEKGCALDTGTTALEKNEDARVVVKKEDVLDEERDIHEAKVVRKLEQLGSFRRVMPSTGDQSTVQSQGQANSAFENLKASAIGARKARGSAFSDQQKMVADVENENRMPPASFSVVRERTGKGTKKRSALAKLAEIAVDQAVKERDPHMFHVPRAPRGRGALDNPKALAAGKNSNENSQEKVCSPAATPALQTRPPQALFKSSSTIDKVPAGGHLSFQEKRPAQDASSASPSKQKERSAGFWFVLQAAESQNVIGALPQLSACYLRIKDGKLPISAVKKYLMKKLHLNNEHEVEITCRGQPVVPNLPLESVRSIWFATMPTSTLMKENPNAEHRSRREGNSCIEDFLMVLTYGRQHRSPT